MTRDINTDIIPPRHENGGELSQKRCRTIQKIIGTFFIFLRHDFSRLSPINV